MTTSTWKKNFYVYPKLLRRFKQTNFVLSRFSVRGRLGSLLMLSANSGFLFAFLAGHYMTYHTIPYIGIVISIVYLAVFLYFPETPTFLLRQKNEKVNQKWTYVHIYLFKGIDVKQFHPIHLLKILQ